MASKKRSLAARPVPDDLKRYLIEKLIVPYKDHCERSPHEMPGVWRGIEDIALAHAGNDLFTYETTYSLDERICSALRVHADARLHVLDTNGAIADVRVDGFDITSQGAIFEIERDLDEVIVQLIIEAD